MKFWYFITLGMQIISLCIIKKFWNLLQKRSLLLPTRIRLCFYLPLYIISRQGLSKNGQRIFRFTDVTIKVIDTFPINLVFGILPETIFVLTHPSRFLMAKIVH